MLGLFALGERQLGWNHGQRDENSHEKNKKNDRSEDVPDRPKGNIQAEMKEGFAMRFAHKNNRLRMHYSFTTDSWDSEEPG